MDVLDRLRARAVAISTSNNAAEPTVTIALPEAEDRRILAAAIEAARCGICSPVLVGDRRAIAASAVASGLDISHLPLVEPARDHDSEKLAAKLERRMSRFSTLPAAQIHELALQPLYYSNLLLGDGRVAGAVMGAVATTTETLQTALRALGPDPQGLVTSCFLMILPGDRALVFADCGVIPEPTSDQLATIAEHAANTYQLLVEDDPRVALLSFSSHGSARHPSVDRVAAAVEILSSHSPDFAFDGELQVDAAIVPEIARRKAPSSAIHGEANVLVFPDLNSGNIAYKLTERLGHARAVGPLLRGLSAPVHDLSRGCSVEDILDTLAITVLDTKKSMFDKQAKRRGGD